MNKIFKVVIAILISIILLWALIFFIDYIRVSKANTNETDVDTSNCKELTRVIMVNEKLYYDTGKESTMDLRCGVMDGKITSTVPENEIPTENNQANFEGNYSYQYGTKNTIEVLIDDKWYVFETKEDNSFYGKVIGATASYIIVEPNENEEIRKSADKISIALGQYNDAIYEVGTNIKVTYDGNIMESYPVQIKATKIELKSAGEFEIRFYDKHPQTDTKIYKVIDKTETDLYDYSVYTYDGHVNILINDQEISLRDALLENKITMEEIISKANEDLKAKNITGDTYNDGGSMIYKYNNYTIIKCHTESGSRDVYIGSKDMTINDLEIY